MEYWWVFYILGVISSLAGGLVLSGIVFRKELGKIREEQREISERRREFQESVHAFESQYGSFRGKHPKDALVTFELHGDLPSKRNTGK